MGEKINWLKEEGYKFPLLAVVDNLNPMALIDVMCDWGAVNVIKKTGSVNLNCHT